MTRKLSDKDREELFEKLGLAFERAIKELAKAKPLDAEKVTREDKPVARLHIDFPDLKDPKGIHERFRGSLEHHIATFDETLLAVVRVPELVCKIFPQIYALNLPDDGNYNRKEVLTRAAQQQWLMLNLLTEFLQRYLNRALEEALNFAVQEKLKYSLPELRDLIDKKYRLTFERGRPPTPQDSQETQKINVLYNELMMVLTPEFDGKSKYEKSKVCEKAVSQYKTELNLRYEIGVQELALTVYDHKKSKRAAVFLMAKMLQKSERQIERDLFGK